MNLMRDECKTLTAFILASEMDALGQVNRLDG